MSMFDPSEAGSTASDIITRSDYAPTDYERYGHWAQKFYGSGCHQHYKDGDMAMAGSAPDDARAAATWH